MHELRLDIRMQLEGMCGADTLVRQGFGRNFAGRSARATRTVVDPGRRAQLPRLRLDHGEKRQLLQVHALRLDFRMQLIFSVW